MRVFVILLFFSLIPIAAWSATTIKVSNADYAGQKIDFYSYADPVTLERIHVFSIEFDKNGECSKALDVKQNQFVFSEFGIYRGMLILEANQTIDLLFPPLREKTFADQKNPYFEPVSFWFATASKKQISSLISDFTIKLNQLTNTYFDRLYFRQSRVVYDSIVYFLNKDFSTVKSKEFQFHQQFTLKMMEAEAFREKPEDYSELFLTVQPEFWIYPSFINLFERTFNNQLSFEAKSIKGTELRTAVNQSNLDFLFDFVKNKFQLTGENGQLVLLKLLHDAWYSGDFSKSAVQSMVNSAVFTKSQNNVVKTTSGNIMDKITFLQPGTMAPTICLKDLSGEKICTNQNKSNFKYLVFIDLDMIVCKEHVKYLSKIYERFEKYLEIYIILQNTEHSEITGFFTENQVPGIKLIDTDYFFSEKYRIKSFPQCFLLDENHKVEFATAKAPLDGFEQQFSAFLQSEFIERKRNQSR